MGKKMQIAVLILVAAVMLTGLIAYIVLDSPLSAISGGSGSALEICDAGESSEKEQSSGVGSSSAWAAAGRSTSDLSSGQKININTASFEQLKQLDGIGETLSLRIIAYRKVYGAFTDIEQLKNVKGLGESKFNAIRDMITVS